MQFNVAQLLKEPVGSIRHFDIDETFEPMEDTASGSTKGSLLFTRTEEGIWVSGALNTRARCTCSRCLLEYWQAVSFTVDEVYFPTIDIVTGASLPLPEDEEDAFTIDESHTLDITEAVRQYTLMNLPMKPLCSEGCAGICPNCGVNRNIEACRCAQERVDPRWLPLLDVLKQSKESRQA